MAWKLLGRPLALVVLAVAMWSLRSSMVGALAPLVPWLGPAMLALCVNAFLGVLVLLAAWTMREAVGSLLNAILAKVDLVEERVFGKLPPRTVKLVRGPAVGAVVAVAMVLVGEVFQATSLLDARMIDVWFNLLYPERSQAELAMGGQETASHTLSDVIVVAIDNDTVQHLGWPMQRHNYARLMDVVSSASPASIVFDVSLQDESQDHPEWDRLVGEAAARAGNVYFSYTMVPLNVAEGSHQAAATAGVLRTNSFPVTGAAGTLRDYSEILGTNIKADAVIEEISTRTRGVALANVLQDAGDDLLRHHALVLRHEDRLYPVLPLRVVADALHVPLEKIEVVPGSHVRVGDSLTVPVDELGRTLVRYQGRYDSKSTAAIRYVSLLSVVRADAAVTLAGNPMGEDQRFTLDEATKVTHNGKPIPLSLVEAARLKKGAWVKGVANYASDPGKILELTILDEEPPAEPEFEVLDESTLRFNTQWGSVKRLGMDPAIFQGRHVLVGSTATAAADLRNASLGAIPGVEHHATMIHNMLAHDFIRPSPVVLNVGVILASGVVAGLAGALLGPGASFLAAFLLLMALVQAVFVAFGQGLLVPVVSPAGSVVLAWLLSVLSEFRAERREKGKLEESRTFIRQTFGRYLTDQVVEALLETPDGLRMGGQRRYVTIMMTDLRGFTSMCATMEPEKVVQLLNNYLGVMTRVINKYNGTIDEFIGDAILVVFGAPLLKGEEELRAVCCAMEMLNAMADVNVWNVAQNLPEVEMGIGIHSGEVVVGNIGSETRAKYGIVGSTINLTSRVESYTVGGQVLISEATKTGCGEALTVGLSQVVSPKGVKGTMTIYEALAVAGNYNVALHQAKEDLLPPVFPLTMDVVVVKEKAVGEHSYTAVVETISLLGMELRVPEKWEKNTNLMMRTLDAAGNKLPGDIYGKVMKPEVRPGVLYMRLTSVPPDAKPVLAKARGEDDGAKPQHLESVIGAAAH